MEAEPPAIAEGGALMGARLNRRNTAKEKAHRWIWISPVSSLW
jgi:hypothetical protein